MTDTEKSTTATEDKASAGAPRHSEIEEHLDHAKTAIKDAVEKVVDKLPGRDHAEH